MIGKCKLVEQVIRVHGCWTDACLTTVSSVSPAHLKNVPVIPERPVCLLQKNDRNGTFFCSTGQEPETLTEAEPAGLQSSGFFICFPSLTSGSASKASRSPGRLQALTSCKNSSKSSSRRLRVHKAAEGSVFINFIERQSSSSCKEKKTKLPQPSRGDTEVVVMRSLPWTGVQVSLLILLYFHIKNSN